MITLMDFSKVMDCLNSKVSVHPDLVKFHLRGELVIEMEID